MKNSTEIIDFHAHVLPAADHGSNSPETSKTQMALLTGAGVDTVVATPHFYPDYHTISDFLYAADSGAELIRDFENRPKLCLGAEVLYCNGLDTMEGLDKLCIRGTNTLLLELPFSDDWDMNMFYTVRRLGKKYNLVLAHIDRYLGIQPEGIDIFLSMGISAQVNASALFSASNFWKLSPYINDGRICALGSDLHMTDKKACMAFARSKKRLGKEFFKIMERTKALIDGAETI